MAIYRKRLPTFKPSEECFGTSSMQSHSAPSSRSSSPILPPKEPIGLETRQHPTSKTLKEKKAKKTTNVEEKILEFDKVGQKSSNYDSSLSRKCSMSLSNNIDSIQCERCDGCYCKLCSNINEAFYIFYIYRVLIGLDINVRRKLSRQLKWIN